MDIHSTRIHGACRVGLSIRLSEGWSLMRGRHHGLSEGSVHGVCWNSVLSVGWHASELVAKAAQVAWQSMISSRTGLLLCSLLHMNS